ncbi:tRNA (adenosine(37)-N6)-dimethylallyltransferase MiaA [Pedobacter deserti]|uniref:tRNA (adenosine(37)-N6)-dimethylallyltransferase MiaA n=1 Tax=Pedobacter deserti TaxID=2817382 RepID=UPI00210B6F91|nr:tRNA (adenosine(37)-N6)-dimethylallyltransferase MiaA [Pedobacter sp. SYSU D00382]
MDIKVKHPLIVVLGPTASGKTRLAAHLAASLNAEIISADSRQIFRGMNVGTGKDLHEYIVAGKSISYHLIDIQEAGAHYHVHAYQEDFYRVFEHLIQKNVLPVLCGGSGMYIHSILQQHQYTAIPVDTKLREILLPRSVEELRVELDKFPEAFTAHADRSSHKRLIRAIEIAAYLSSNTPETARRPEIDALVIGLYTDIARRRQRVSDRLLARLEGGLIEEVECLMKAGVGADMLKFYGLEYKFVSAYLLNEMSYDEMVERLAIAISQFAKRQMTFFRKMEKDGVHIHWLEADRDFEALYFSALELIQQKFGLGG